MDRTILRGERVPSIGLGTWGLSGRTCRLAVYRALEMGYRHIDTARKYGNERRIGEALAASSVDRDEVFVTTKVWGRNATHEGVHESARESLDRLGVEYVDLLLLHWPNPRVPIEESMLALAELRDEGIARHIGVSNFGPSRLRRARRASDAPLFANQAPFHPYKPQTELVEQCRRREMVLIAYSPLSHGGVSHDPVLRIIGERYDKTPAQVALRWVIQHDGVVAIPRATSPIHQRENLDVFDFELTDDEMDRIRRPSRLRTAFGWVRGRLQR